MAASDPRQQMQTAVALQRNGRHEEALGIYSKLMVERPDFADAFHFGGLAAHALGKDVEARELLLTAERIAPERTDLLPNTIRFFQEIGEADEAESRAARAYHDMPQDPRALFQYADMLRRRDRGDALVQELERLANRYPQDTGVWILLARCQLQGGYRAEARASFESSCAGTHEAVVGRLEFADFLRENNELDNSKRQYEMVLQQGSPPQRAAAEYGLATIAGQFGDRREARMHADRALAADPDASPQSWLLRVRAADDEELAALRPELEAAHAAAAHSDDALFLDFALGNFLERSGEYPPAWDAYVRGNRARRLTVGYDPDKEAQFFADIRRCIDAEFMSRHAQAANSTELPIFIVGMPRSGTTLVERALGGHPAVREGGEMKVLGDILRRHAGPEARHRLPVWLGECQTQEIRSIGDEWHAALLEKSQGADRITDKLPMNFAHIGLIKTCFPNATIIHVKRDPREVFVSSWSMVFDTMLPYSYDADEFRDYFKGYQSLMKHWAQLGVQRFIEVEYRQLIENFEETVTQILNTAGLEWHPDCAGFASRPGNVGTASLFQVRRPLYTDSLGRWERFREQLGPLADPRTWRSE